MELKSFKDLGGKTWRIRRRITLERPEWSAFNPSIGFNLDGSAIGLFRSSNYKYNPDFGNIQLTTGSKIVNNIYFSELDSEFKPKNLSLLEIVDCPFPIIRGIEDPKLYFRNNQWYFTGVVQEPIYCPRPRMATFKLLSSSQAKFLELWDITDEKVEKNWMVAPSNEYFDFIYGHDSLVVGGNIVFSADMRSGLDSLRGTSNLINLDSNTYIAMVHEVHYIDGSPKFDPASFSHRIGKFKTYTHRFAKYSKYGELIGLSDPFFFDIKGVEFASGIALKDGILYVSYGQKDESAHIAVINVELVLPLLKEV